MTIYVNWADKGAIQLKKLIPALKEVALQEGANLNVDETSLQSDGYNVYTYLDGELMNIEYLCCMDYFWAKAKQAGISFREYFRRVILEMKYGRTDNNLKLLSRACVFWCALQGRCKGHGREMRVIR